MMKKLFSLFAVSISLVVQGQISLSVQLPPAGLVHRDQLWNLAVINNTPQSMEASLFLTLKDGVTGQSVLTAGTRSFLLGRGVKLLSVREVQPVQYQLNTAAAAGNYLPLGNYILCYSLQRTALKELELVAEECVRIQIAPLSPPLLQSPANAAVLATTVPQFSWIPPAPLDMFSGLTYQISVSEVLESQSPGEAILYNTPLFTRAFIKAPYETYPATFARLEAGRTYAWQVTAQNEGGYAAATEVWTFSIGKDSVPGAAQSAAFLLLDSEGGASGLHYITGRRVHVKYYSYDAEHEALVRLLSAEGKVLLQKKQKIAYGDNYLGYALNNHFSKEQVYVIELTDSRGQKHSASFMIK